MLVPQCFAKFNSSFHAECVVRPPSKRVAAIPDDAIASAILFCDRMVAKISERRKSKCTNGRIYEKQSTALFCDCTHNSVIRNALF
ncbi:hypothetical protein TNCV_3193391 [Trichonephila clavipes]|nr:hypothetical protein TNCV_3193391 [Trichonephila clavipes]